ncbi:PREDICTED: protein downstream neighbor of son homolog [Diuraphis noxia]|uniref:protein downstream neighbor of son homolog n=1 Tax=Diuraphis noxia TaxID=143948 RepID=UPI00076388B6|nr:PREDICTED: protein downstream neighbor of son homolog [Diuraphis noxia]
MLELDSGCTPPKWKRPEDVMKMHRMKMKKRALQARFVKSMDTTTPGDLPTGRLPTVQRSPAKNPFRRKTPVKNKKQVDAREMLKRARVEYDDDNACTSNLSKLIRDCESIPSVSSYSQCPALDESVISFVDVLRKVNPVVVVEDVVEDIKGEEQLPIDWTLRTKVRFLSPNPFPWSQKIKTCEEASATTGFVRCLDTENIENSLDTSPNSRFHQCCMAWQHPSLPWVDLIHRGPRVTIKDSASSVPSINANPIFRESLFTHWIDSFRSLFQLVRANQCPYFYVLANAFTCTFRASSIGGYEELNAMIYPTTQGLRDVLRREDIDFTMPLLEENEQSSELFTKNTLEDAKIGEDEEPERWLETMGAEKSEIKRLQSSQSELVSSRQRKIDSTKESLVVVTGVEAQALFNWLINCRSTVSNTGPHAGIPPTLLAPVAFSGSTLTPLKVRQSTVKVDGQSYNSIEVKGPVLPDAVYNFCDLLSKSLKKFTATFANLESTKPFTLASETKKEYCNSQKSEDKAIHLFGQQNLSDCGLRDSVLKKFCSATTKAFDSVKYIKDDGYFIS